MLARLALVALLAVLAAGCGCGPQCTVTTCPDGCCKDDVCRVGGENAACGGGGRSCATCSTVQVCSAGMCVAAPCGAATCSGCCDAQGKCVGLTTQAQCGKMGNACASCLAGQACIFGECATDPDVCDGGPTVTTTQLQPVLAARCVTGCHAPMGTGIAYGNFTSAANSQQMVGATSLYADTDAALKIVEARRPANSTLWLKMSTPAALGRRGPNGENTGSKMPNDGTMVTAAELQQFKDWICSGANP